MSDDKVLDSNLCRHILNVLAYAAVHRHMDIRSADRFAELAMEVFEAGAEASDNRHSLYQNLRGNVRELEIITKYDGWIDGHAAWRNSYLENY